MLDACLMLEHRPDPSTKGFTNGGRPPARPPRFVDESGTCSSVKQRASIRQQAIFENVGPRVWEEIKNCFPGFLVSHATCSSRSRRVYVHGESCYVNVALLCCLALILKLSLDPRRSQVTSISISQSQMSD